MDQSSIFCILDIHFFQHHLLKRLFFIHCIALSPLLKIIDHVFVDLYLDPLFTSIDLFVYHNATLS